MPNETEITTLISPEGIIAIVVALLGVAGGIWAQFVQFKKDAKRMDDINTHVGTVKADTSEMKPQVSTVDENVKKIRDEVVEKVVPNVGKLSGIDTLVRVHEIQEAIKRENSPNLYDKDTLKGTIDLVYTENAKLARENNEKNHRITELEIENTAYRSKCQQFDMELQQIKEENTNLIQENSRLNHELTVKRKPPHQGRSR